MEDTERNRQTVIEELGKLRAVDPFFSQDAAVGHLNVMIRKFPNIATVKGVIEYVLETATPGEDGRTKIPTPAQFLELLKVYVARRSASGGYCSTCDDTGFRIEQHIVHERTGPFRFSVAVPCGCGNHSDTARCRQCGDIGWFYVDGTRRACACGHGEGFDPAYQALGIKDKLRADGVDDDLIGKLDDSKSEFRTLLMHINSEKHVRRYRSGDHSCLQQGAA